MFGFLGGLLGKITAGSIGGKLLTKAGEAVLGGIAAKKGLKDGHKQDQLAREANFEFLESKGLTPTEIVGSGSAGTPGSSGGQVLGNNYTAITQQAVQNAFQAQEREKDRQVAREAQATNLQAAQTSAGATLGAARLNANTAANRLAFDKDLYENVTLPESLNKQVTESPEFVRNRILATMASDNIIATALANEYGIDPMDPESLKKMSTSELRSVVRTIYGYQSTIFKETAGSSTIIQEGVQDGLDQVQTLGNKVKEQAKGVGTGVTNWIQGLWD